MKQFLMAWRNLWRNKKRTLITVTAVLLAVVLSTIMSSMQEGTYSKMIDNVVKFYTGYIQIMHPEYWKSKSINDVIEENDSIKQVMNSVSEIEMFVPRLESFTLLSSGENTKGAALIGIDPGKEDEFTNLSHWVDKGQYLKPNDDGILVAINLAKQLDICIGDTLVLLSQGYHGATAAGLFPVRGILKFPSPDLNNLGAYIELNRAQDFFSAYGKITSFALLIDHYKSLGHVKNMLEEKLGGQYNIMSWKELQPELVQMIEGDRAGGVIMKAILYLVIGFGIFGTIIMMVSERQRESGIMIAIGMKRYKLELVLFFETMLIGIIGVLAGFIISIPVITAFVNNPIPLPEDMAQAFEVYGLEAVMYFSMMPKIFMNQVITVLIITIVISLYPILKIANLNLTSAIRG